ncbi:MAG: pitrilysin family protein [Acidobacteriota bacterium]
MTPRLPLPRISGARLRGTHLRGALLISLAILLALPLAAQDLASFEKKTTVHTLDNGWTFIIVERPTAPVFSFATIVRVGSAQEVPGITGLAHMFEHMAFKGTRSLGTTDYAAEAAALEELEASYLALQDERLKAMPDEERLASLEEAFRDKQEAAQEYVVQNAFDQAVERAGGVGMNAFTNADWTGYFYSLPANRIELFAALESDRFYQPVFREFYQERDVVQEERRLRTESQPIGRMVEQFLSTAFVAHPYKQPTVGYMSDLESFTMTDAGEFFETYYAPSNLVTAVVGHVDAEQLVPLLDRYFGRIPKRAAPQPLRTVEPPQIGEKIVRLEDRAQPFYLEGYHKPAATHPDQAVFDAIDDVLSNGRTSRLHRRLIRDEQKAVTAQTFSGFPGDRYPNLWTALTIPARGVNAKETQAILHEEIERLKTEDVTEEELERFRARAKADLVRGLRSNQGLAAQLATYHALYGDWRELFLDIERLEAVTAQDIRRVAQETFRPDNRTVVYIETVSDDSGEGR